MDGDYLVDETVRLHIPAVPCSRFSNFIMNNMSLKAGVFIKDQENFYCPNFTILS